MIIFDGYKLAKTKEQRLKNKVDELSAENIRLKIAAILFKEDKGSQLYTQLKSEAAQRVGIAYEVHEFSIADPVEIVIKKIQQLNLDETVTGIIIQKPTRAIWHEETKETFGFLPSGFDDWWHSLTSVINPNKDVDGLHPDTLEAIKNGTWKENGKVLPATAQAILVILASEILSLRSRMTDQKILILNRSDILGKPLYLELKNRGVDVSIWGSKQLKSQMLELKSTTQKSNLDFDVIVSATGRKHLITGDMVKEGVVLIDAGEPQPDVDFESVKDKVSFITPVPGGVGPMTVVCLLENCVDLVSKK